MSHGFALRSTSLAGMQRACPACVVYTDTPRRIRQAPLGCSPVCTASRHRSSPHRKAGSLAHTARHTPSKPCLGAAVPCGLCIPGAQGMPTVGNSGHTRGRTPRRPRQTGRRTALSGTRGSRRWANTQAEAGCPSRGSPGDKPPSRWDHRDGRTNRHDQRRASRPRRHSLYRPKSRRSVLPPGARQEVRRNAPAARCPKWPGCGRRGFPGTARPRSTGCRCSTPYRPAIPPNSRGVVHILHSTRRTSRTS
jgi:hypothetical protein